MRQIRTFLSLVVFGIGITIHADEGTSAPPDDLKQVCKDVINQISRGDPKGFDLLCQYLTVPPGPDQYDKLSQTYVKQALAAKEHYGNFLGGILSQEKEVHHTLRKHVYIARYEKGVVCWRFLLYQSHDEWKILYAEFADSVAAVNSLFD
jgi:hypothetical protein